jgi:hypothetical protein
MAQPRTPTTVSIDWGTHEEGAAWEAAHDDTVRKATNDDDSAWEAVNENTSVNGTDKGVSRSKAEVANAKAAKATETATEVAETAAEMAETATEVTETSAVTTHRRCLSGSRKIDTRKLGSARLDCSERQNGERQRRPSKLMLEHWTLRMLLAVVPLPPQRGWRETQTPHSRECEATPA